MFSVSPLKSYLKLNPRENKINTDRSTHKCIHKQTTSGQLLCDFKNAQIISQSSTWTINNATCSGKQIRILAKKSCYFHADERSIQAQRHNINSEILQVQSQNKTITANKVKISSCNHCMHAAKNITIRHPLGTLKLSKRGIEIAGIKIYIHEYQ